MKQRRRFGFYLASGSVTAAIAAGLVAGCGSSGNPGGLPGSSATLGQVTRGRYLVVAAGCSDCHNRGTDNPSDPNWLAGYIPNPPQEQGKFEIGPLTSYAANLTPDVATGLGSWTPQDIFNALRNGHDKAGNVLCPPMPWPATRNYSDDDTWAIVAYLRSIKPVSNSVPEDTEPGTPVGQHPDCSVFYTGLQPVPLFPGANETTP